MAAVSSIRLLVVSPGLDSYDVFDRDGSAVYTVKGELSWGHRLQIYDAQGEHLGTVQEKVFTLLLYTILVYFARGFRSSFSIFLLFPLGALGSVDGQHDRSRYGTGPIPIL